MLEKYMSKKYKIKRNDNLRVLLTDVLPFETPLIFSNVGFYNCIGKFLKNITDEKIINFFKTLGIESPDLFFRESYSNQPQNNILKRKIPLTYSIKKDATDKRFLTIPHPVSQLIISSFYSYFSDSILYFCSKSHFSLRYPNKIATSYYDFSGTKDFSQFKSVSHDRTNEEPLQKYATNYFSYQLYNRLFSYINSTNFFQSELQFKFLRKLDISHCFDSIYTHSIAWATKNKESAKLYTKSATFGNEFDSLMRNLNDGETLGIIIGPEVSRIFAEIILQSIDYNVNQTLKDKNFKNNRDYSIKRYVDDYFIFTNSIELSETIKSVLIDECKFYKLNLNTKKEILLESPFATINTCAIEESRKILKSFYSTFLKKKKLDDSFKPKFISNPDNLVISFGNKIKIISKELNIELSNYTSFILGSLTQKIILFTRNNKIETESLNRCESALEVLLKAIFYIYGLCPTVSSSYNVCLSATIAIRFVKNRELKRHLEAKIHYLIFNTCQKILVFHLQKTNSRSNSNEPLEVLNLLIMLKEIKPSFLLPCDFLLDFFNFFKRGGTKDYFLLTSLLFYIENDSPYKQLKKQIVSHIDKTFEDTSTYFDISSNCEQLLYIFDILSCPYLPLDSKKHWARLIQPTLKIKSFDFNLIYENTWFTNWNESDLLNLLEKKRKQIVY